MIVIVMLAVLSLLLFFCALQMEVYPDASRDGSLMEDQIADQTLRTQPVSTRSWRSNYAFFGD